MSARSRSPQPLLRLAPWKDPRRELHVGCTVRLKGLNVQRNGQRARVEAFVESSGKWRVRILGSNQLAALKPEFLMMEAPADVMPKQPPAFQQPRGGATDSSRQAKLEAKVVREKKQQPEPKSELELELDGLRLLEPGCLVVLHDLKSAQELNGQQGTVDRHITETGRWRVKLQNGETKDLKSENLTVTVPEAAPEPEPEVADGPEGIELPEGEACGPGGRFLVQEKIGAGNFSTVYRCKDATVEGVEYAVKFARAGEEKRVALERELMLVGHICQQVGQQDPEAVRCIVNLAFLEGFEHKGRLAAAYEHMKCNLRTALQKYGANGGGGLPLLPTVRNFGRQLFLALRALRKAGFIHCDVKPENLLLGKDNESVKLGDFGSTLGLAERMRTDELQPRHYRAPEVILGQDYDMKIDIWSAACTLYELATGRVLFAGETNNNLLHEMLKVCGAFPLKFTQQGTYAANHFNAKGDFLMGLGGRGRTAIPPASFKMPLRPLQTVLADLLREPPRGVAAARHEGLVSLFADLLTRLLRPEPGQRPNPEQANQHRFFQKGAA